MATNPDQTVDGDKVPILKIFLVGDFLLDKLQLLGGIIYKGTQVLLLARAQGVVKDCVHFSLDPAAGIAQHVLESQVLTVQVSKEMLGAFRQVQDSLKIDDLGAGGCHIGETAGKQFQEIEVSFSFFRFQSCHAIV